MARLFFAVLLTPIALLADVPPACAPGTLVDYINLGAGGCKLGGNLFYDFMQVFLPAGASEIDPAMIAVEPATASGMQGLRFSMAAIAGPGEFLASDFAYSVLMPGGKPRFGLSMSGASATGDGAATAVANLCLGDAYVIDLCFAPTASLITFATEFDELLSGELTLDSLNLVGVANHIGIDGGVFGRASLESVTNTLVQTPEPAAAYLFITCLAGAAWLRWRRIHFQPIPSSSMRSESEPRSRQMKA